MNLSNIFEGGNFEDVYVVIERNSGAQRIDVILTVITMSSYCTSGCMYKVCYMMDKNLRS